MGELNLPFALLMFFSGAAAVVIATPMVRQWAVRKALLDIPSGLRKIHAVPVPRLGGIAIYAAFLLVYAWVSLRHRAQAAELDGWEQLFLLVTPMFALGLWDDFRPLGAKKKLIGQILISVAVFYAGMRIETISNPFTRSYHFIGWWGLPLTVLWIVAITNLINLIDGLDGLAAGVSLFLMVVMAGLAAAKISLPLFLLSLGMAGVLAGFLIYNFPPARIFLGDGGAYFLGSLIAGMALVNSGKGEVVAAMVVPFFALGLPVLDTALAILRRGILGLPIFRGDRQHIHHRLLDMGFSQRRTVVFLYMVCAMMCLVAVVFFGAGSRWWALSLGVVFTVAIFSVRGLGYVKSWDKLGLQLAGSVEKRRAVQMALLSGKLLVLEAEGCADWGEFRRLLAEKLEKLGFHSFHLRSSVKGIEAIDWKPENPRPWNIEDSEWVEIERALRVDWVVVGSLKVGGYADEDYMDHFSRIADVFSESVEEAFQACHRRIFELQAK